MAFRGAPTHRVYGAYRDISHARTGQTHCIQHHHSGAVIAHAYSNTIRDKDRAEWRLYVTSWQLLGPLFAPAFSLCASFGGLRRSLQQPLFRVLKICKCLDCYTSIPSYQHCKIFRVFLLLSANNRDFYPVRRENAQSFCRKKSARDSEFYIEW